MSQVLTENHQDVLSFKYTMSVLLETRFVLLSIKTTNLFLTRPLSLDKVGLFKFQDLSLFACIYESI